MTTENNKHYAPKKLKHAQISAATQLAKLMAEDPDEHALPFAEVLRDERGGRWVVTATPAR